MSGNPKKVPAVFYRIQEGSEPVRDWLKGLRAAEDRKRIGRDIATVEYGWPIGMPTCKPLKDGLYEVRTDLTGSRIARVLFCFADGQMILLHGFIKKSRTLPREDEQLARRRMKEVKR